MSGRRRKQLIAFAIIVVGALFLSGFVTGEIGARLSAKFGREGATGVLPQPEVHLPPQPLFPAEAREQFHQFELHEKHPDEFEKEYPGVEPPSSPFQPMRFFVSNTMLSAWLTSAVILVVFLVAARRPSLVPRRLQNLCEMIIEALLNFVEGVAGKEWGRRLFPVVATIFLFVLLNAWMALLPTYPSFVLHDQYGETDVLRSAATDMNMPLALALVSFVFVEFYGFKALGFSYLGKFVRVRDILKGRPTGLIDAFVGVLEGFSEFIRILSFTFRLFGNMTAGEILVLVTTFLLSFVATVLVYGLEMLVGFVQALIFAGLTLVFATLALTPHSHEEQHS